MALTSLTWGLHTHTWSLGPGAPFKSRPGQATVPCLSYVTGGLVLSPGSGLVFCLDVVAR